MIVLQNFGSTYRRWRRYARVVEELSAYSDRELMDMGIARADIHRIAREASR